MQPQSTVRQPQEDASDTAGAAPRVAGGETKPLGVREQLELLRKAAPTIAPESGADKGRARSTISAMAVRRLIKTALALALVVGLGWMPLQRLYLTTSAEATVNARVITLRSPIEGRIVDWRTDSSVGAPLHAGDTVLRIENARADRSRLDELRRGLSALQDQREASVERIAQLEILRAEQLSLFENFSRHRIAQIEARQRELAADKEAAAARRDAAALALNRSVALLSRGAQAEAANEQAVREHKVLVAQ